MPLFTDGLMSDQEDLREVESSILGVTHSESIELTPKLRVAQREVGFEVTTFLLRHAAEVVDLNAGLTNVGVTPELQYWHVVQTLAAVYRDAYFSRLNDRFKEKWAQFSLLTRQAKEAYFGAGVGIVEGPIARAGRPSCSSVPGGSLSARYYLVSTAWHRSGESGAASEPIAAEVEAGSRLTILHEETVPNGATGWSVYVSKDGKPPTRQNEGPLSIGQEWTEPAEGVRKGHAMPGGQLPTRFIRAKNILGRG